MPNTLAHIGVHLPLTRTLWRRGDALWIYLGCLLPDMPWIMLRVLLTVTTIDEPSLRLHATGQASLLGSLVLAACATSLARRPGRTFALLGFGTLLHLLLDACQRKWANGVSFFAPFDWQLVRFDLFWPEELPTVGLTALGAIVFLVESRRRRQGMIDPRPFAFSTRRVTAAVALLCAWGLWPLAARSEAYAADVHFLRTLGERASRTGAPIELDRVRYVPGPGPHHVLTTVDEVLVLDRPFLDHRARVSLRGRFVAPDTIAVAALHDHTGPLLPLPLRDVYSYGGLLLIGLTWLRALRAEQRRLRASRTRDVP